MKSSSLPALVARVCTEVLSPFVLVAGVVTLVAWLTDPDWERTSVLAVGFISVVPLVLSLVMTRAGKVTDKFIRHRRQRHLFYALSLGSMLLGATLVMVVPASYEARVMVSLAVGTLLAVMVINTRLKISIHALIAALSGVVVSAALTHAAVVVFATAVWGLASWSRVYLRRHTVIEVLSGSALGALVAGVFLLLVGGLPTPS